MVKKVSWKNTSRKTLEKAANSDSLGLPNTQSFQLFFNNRYLKHNL